MNPATELYQKRLLSQGYPNLETLGVEYFKVSQSNDAHLNWVMTCVTKLVDMSTMPKTVAVVGCGPQPYALRALLAQGFDATGIEPVPGSVQEARAFLNNSERVHLGSAEVLPYANQSQSLVLLESVLEHVDSPLNSLAECYRVLAPGGVLYVYTTNRLRFSLTGQNGEFRTRFYNWFPGLVKESYVFKHLHFAPHLSNFSPRPAVHWFTFTDLCKLGRLVGFAQFYSHLDLVDVNDPSVKSNSVRRFLVANLQPRVIQSPWLRALALTQYGNSIFMYKRPESH
ncbi:MAG TPA: class I SAM-dependent methyltransferase [Bryobacteraceae bacterium]|nr:class I SAM-dependent methyltransferase [Bryobacteraceae bacterium]